MKRRNQVATVKSVASRSCSSRLAEVSTFLSSGVNAVEPRRGLAERLELTFVQVAHRQELVLADGHHPHPLDIGVAVFPAATAKVFGALFGLLVFEFKFLNCGLKALYELFQFQGFRLQFNDVRCEESSLGEQGLGPGVDVGLVDRGHSTITVVVPEDAGNALGAIVLRQLPNLDQWDWGRLEPWVYFGDYSLRGKGERGLATAFASGSEEDLNIEFNPAIEPGHTVNVVFRGFNPQSSIYQWSTELMADGEDPVRYLGPTLRLNVYQQDPYR